VRDPDRKGKAEKSFRLLWDDLLKGAEFESWEHLMQCCRRWLDETPGVGNLRVHGTTRRVPNEAYREEREFLIRLPRERFPVWEQGIRDVDQDSTVSIRGRRYTVPAALALRAVPVHLYAEHFEVLDPHGHIAFSRRYARDDERGLIIDQTYYALLQRRPRGDAGGERLDQAFLRRFPSLAPLGDGLKHRFKTLAPVHLRALLRLVDRFGEPAFLAAASRAQEYRRFDSTAVERILEREHPFAEKADPVPPLGGIGPTVLGEVEPGSLDTYAHLDTTPTRIPTVPTTHQASPTTEAASTETTTNDEEENHGA
jgi:hypothetical protein